MPETAARAVLAELAMHDVQNLTNEALGFGDLDLATCPRAQLNPPPMPFHLR